MKKCPLCNSPNSIELSLVQASVLNRLYKSFTKEDFSYLLNQDLVLRHCQNCSIKFFDPMIIGDQFFYESLQRNDWYYLDYKYEYEVAINYIDVGDLVLDVGCGRGAFSEYVRKKGGRFLGLDSSDSAKKIGIEKGVNIKPQSIQDYSKVYPESVDVVTSFQVCEHVSDVKGFIEAKLNVLKKNGTMIIAVPSEESFLSQVTNGILNMPPHHVTKWEDNVFHFISKKYNINLESFHHERLQDIHVEWYLSTLIQNSILKPRLVDIRVKRKFIAALSALLAKVLRKGLADDMRPYGHTVVAVFKKK